MTLFAFFFQQMFGHLFGLTNLSLTLPNNALLLCRKKRKPFPSTKKFALLKTTLNEVEKKIEMVRKTLSPAAKTKQKTLQARVLCVVVAVVFSVDFINIV